MNKLYSEGLLDAEVYGQSDEQKKQKDKNDQLGLFADYFSFFTTGRSEIEAMNDAMFQPLTSKWSPEAVIPGSPRISQGTFAITMSIHRRKLRCAGWITSILKKVRNISNKDLKAFFWEYKKKC